MGRWLRMLVGILMMAVWMPAQAADVWQAASPDRPVRLPADHASHPAYKTEWWYYTGHLTGEDGRRYGYELTFFRHGQRPKADPRSRWSIDHLYLAHFALTDVDGRRFRYAERLNRGGLGLAGARTDRYEVWNEDWRASAQGDTHNLQAETKDMAIDLQLISRKPPVLHGEAGYSRKGDCDSCASHYYSLTRLETSGTLVVDGRRIPVRGMSWMDHEFSSGLLQPNQVGWDWFSLQFDDGSDLMLFQLRQTDGKVSAQSSGTWVDPDGKTHPLQSEQMTVTPRRQWRSPVSGGVYPTAWQVTIPSRQVTLTIEALLDEQELRTEGSTRVTYWEGAVNVRGKRGDLPVTGRGYVELTGYDKPFNRPL